MRISDWSSDVCSSDLKRALEAADAGAACLRINPGNIGSSERVGEVVRAAKANGCSIRIGVNAGSLEKDLLEKYGEPCPEALVESALRSEEHTSELQSLMRISYAVFCLKKKKSTNMIYRY